MTMTLAELAERLGATIVGEGDRAVSGCAGIQEAGRNQVTFLANRKYARFLTDTDAAAVLIRPDQPSDNDRLTRLECEDPYFAFRNAMIELHGFREHREPIGRHRGGISDAASIHPDATIGEGTRVHQNATVERGAVIGCRCQIYPGVFVGEHAEIGDDCILFPNVTIYDRCRLGDRVTIHASTVIGQDGFGYATHAGKHHKIPQSGIVVIENDVELGSGCAIERAAMGETRIGEGTKFADLISIGHGTTIGRHCLFVSLVGIAGSVTIGDYVVLGGQTGVSGHLTIGNGVQALGKTAIVSDIEPGQIIGGIPAVDADTAKRNALTAANLHELHKRVKKLERARKD
tara:strand:+ start:10126 stop:11163 length:1038 start_codon:yes stop_codon:yes gene_type:complete